MLIFDTYRDLCAALALPPLEPGAYRFLPQYGKAGFQCAQCGAVKLFPLAGVGTGYGVQHDQMFCYECCSANERQAMRAHVGPFFCYVRSAGDAVTSWPGGVLGRVHSYAESRSGWNGGVIARFHVRDTYGNWWQGRGAGRGMACTLRPMKAPAYAARWGR